MCLFVVCSVCVYVWFFFGFAIMQGWGKRGSGDGVREGGVSKEA